MEQSTNTAILPITYLGPVSYYALLKHFDDVVLEKHEHFIKQTYRNRCYILSANGKLPLTIPIAGPKNHVKIKDLQISYAENWQHIHWKSIQSAYGTTPYFEFYADEYRNVYQQEFKSLIDFNLHLHEITCQQLDIPREVQFTTKYISESDGDFRNAFNLKGDPFYQDGLIEKYPDYLQAFSDKLEFIRDLSILDLIFNLGPEAGSYLNDLIVSKTEKS